MTQSGVLPFVRGIDFTKYDFNNDTPKLLNEMERLRWIKLNSTGLKEIPQDIGTLKKLEQLHLIRNNLNKLDDKLSNLECLKVLNARKNHLTNDSISNDIWNLPELSVLVS